jgi:hypothetical protein
LPDFAAFYRQSRQFARAIQTRFKSSWGIGRRLLQYAPHARPVDEMGAASVALKDKNDAARAARLTIPALRFSDR